MQHSLNSYTIESLYILVARPSQLLPRTPDHTLGLDLWIIYSTLISGEICRNICLTMHIHLSPSQPPLSASVTTSSRIRSLNQPTESRPYQVLAILHRYLLLCLVNDGGPRKSCLDLGVLESARSLSYRTEPFVVGLFVGRRMQTLIAWR
jgi:hypothetical protein